MFSCGANNKIVLLHGITPHLLPQPSLVVEAEHHREGGSRQQLNLIWCVFLAVMNTVCSCNHPLSSELGTKIGLLFMGPNGDTEILMFWLYIVFLAFIPGCIEPRICFPSLCPSPAWNLIYVRFPAESSLEIPLSSEPKLSSSWISNLFSIPSQAWLGISVCYQAEPSQMVDSANKNVVWKFSANVGP